MSPALANFLFEVVNFSLLAVALGWVLFKPVRTALDREREEEEKRAEEGKRLKAEAEALLAEARAVHQKAEKEAGQRGEELLQIARTEAARLLEQSRSAQAGERRALLRELEAQRGAEVAALSDAVANVAAESVRRLLASLSGPGLDLALVRAACEELRRMPNGTLGQVLVESARTLEPEARASLEEVLPRGFSERTSTDLGAGIRITTNAGQIDASALSIARQAAREVARMLGNSDRTEHAGS